MPNMPKTRLKQLTVLDKKGHMFFAAYHVRNNFQKLKKSIFLGASLFGRKTALVEKTHCSIYIFHYFINRLFIKTNILYNNSSLK
jgi:hypothetical protein